MPSKLVRVLLAGTFAGFLSLGGQSLAAADYPFMEKLQQCEAAFKASRDNNATRAEGIKARERHIKLVVEILQNLNSQNVEAGNRGRPLTPEELSINVRVMGHLIEMLAIDHMAPKYDWSYTY